MAKQHILDNTYAEELESFSGWFTLASSLGYGNNKNLQVEIGGNRFRVTAGCPSKPVYTGRDAKKAVRIYNKLP